MTAREHLERQEKVSERALCELESALDAAGMGMTDEETGAAS